MITQVLIVAGFMLLIVGFIYYQVRMLIGLTAALLYIVLLAVSQLLLSVTLIILSLIWLLMALFIMAVPLRRKLVTRPLLVLLRQRLPKLSSAEQQALEIGDEQWTKQLLSGQPDWSIILDTKTNTVESLSATEQAFLNDQVETLCKLLDQHQFTDDQSDLPAPIWEYIRAQGFWGLTIAPEYGGFGFSARGHAAVITKLVTRSYSVAIMVMVPNSLGPAEFIGRFGTEVQKKHYLPRLAAGQEVPCFALTSPSAGSDASSIIDKGVVCRGEHQGRQVLGVRLNWNKRYITLAPIATLIGLAFKCYDPEHLLGEQDNIGITLALIPAETPGVTRGQRHHPMNLAFMNGPIIGQNVFIPLDWVIGGREGCGQGWRMMLQCLAVGRGISLPALSVGTAELSMATSSAYAVVRRQFNRSIGEFEGIQVKLAEIAGFTYLCQSVQRMLCQHIQQGDEPAVASAIAKYHLTELSRQVLNAAMDIHAGRGIQLGPRNYLAMLYQAAPINITVEGANILTRNLIILGQAVVRCHPYLLQELTLMQQPTVDLKTFDRVFWRHVRHFSSQIVRSLVYGITGGRWIRVSMTKQPARRWLQQLTRMSSALSVLTDMSLLVIGKQLKSREALAARLGDGLSYLYLASAVVKRHQAQDDQQHHDVVADWCVRYCLLQIQDVIEGLLQNYANTDVGHWMSKYLGRLLRWLVFPWGRAYRQPMDQLSFTMAELVQQDSKLRQALMTDCYKRENSAVNRVEVAMKSVLAAAPILQKLAEKCPQHKHKGVLANQFELQTQQACQLGILSKQECEQLSQMHHLCYDAIQVDSFE